jgi:secreted trypsin-like serine protease
MYDVLHENSGGVILQEDDYFVHYLAPSGFSVLEKNIVFVIDIALTAVKSVELDSEAFEFGNVYQNALMPSCS